MRWLGQQVRDDLGIARGQKNVAVLFVLLAKLAGVDQVAVVGDRNLTAREVEQQRLGVDSARRAGRRISDMPDGNRIPQGLKLGVVEDLVDQPDRSVSQDR